MGLEYYSPGTCLWIMNQSLFMTSQAVCHTSTEHMAFIKTLILMTRYCNSFFALVYHVTPFVFSSAYLVPPQHHGFLNAGVQDHNDYLFICSCLSQILTELGGFEVKESKFRREMEKLRNLQSRDLALEVDRDRDQLIQQTMRQLNTHFGRRCTTTPMAVHRVKVTFKDEPGEGSGVARSFYTAIALALLSNDKLPNLDCVQSVSKGMQASSTCHHDYNSSMTIHRNYTVLWNSFIVAFNGTFMMLKVVIT